MILVDTSLWIDHLHKPVLALVEALERENVLVHPFVIGELACGRLAKRHEFLALLSALPMSTMATDDEALHFLEQNQLMGRGLGWIDVHLLASVMLTNQAKLWTTDKQLVAAASELKLAHDGK